MKHRAFNRPIDGAIYCFNQGFKVFPIVPNGKSPSIKGWQDWAETATLDKVINFGKANPLYNWGVYCGPSGLLVVDIDTKKDRPGKASLQALMAQHGELPGTLTIVTPSGGLHLYFKGSGKSSTGTLGEGLDTRGEGGYVVAPGSRIDERVYEVLSEAPVAEAPAWLPAAILERSKPVVIGEDTGTRVEEGQRNNILASLAGTMRTRGMNYESILAALLTVNETQLDLPLPDHEVEAIARSISRYEPKHAKAASDFLEPVKDQAFTASIIDPSRIPPRDWIMWQRYIGGFISVIISPGGVGKSTLTMLDAVSVATGKNLTGFDIRKKGGVWIYNLEDPADELKRRMTAISIHHKIPLTDLDNVHITSGRDNPLILAKQDSTGIVINKDAIDSVVEYIRKHNIVLFIADPFVRIHELSENDNMQIDKVVWCCQRIADRTGCAIGLVHHTSKAGARQEEQGDMHTGRGASSLVYASRIAHTIAAMSEKEADRFGISSEKRKWYMRLDNAKANLQPPAERADWFERFSIILENGDSVGTVERALLTDIAAGKAKERAEAEKRDVAEALNNCMNIGEQITVDEVFDRLFGAPEYEHLFKTNKSKKRAKEKLLEIIKTGLKKDSKFFEYQVDLGSRYKHWIMCKPGDFLN